MRNVPIEELLAPIPRMRLAVLPTPLEYECELSGGQHLYLKRDDLTGLGMGGNKVRKLEFLVAEARRRESDLLVTVGSAQSNHACLTAAAGARAGLPVHLVLGGESMNPLEGNQLLGAHFGAELHNHASEDWEELTQQMNELCQGWRGQGLKPYALPIGGSTPIGALGFVAAWAEMLAQLQLNSVEASLVVHASSSGGTHAGLLAGRALFGGPPILAVGVAKTPGLLADETRAIAKGALEMLGSTKTIADEDIDILDGYLGDAYAVPTRAGDDAIFWGSRRGLVFDRVYTGKALSGLLGESSANRLPEGNIIFWHSGGYPSVFATGGVPRRLHGVGPNGPANG